MNHSGARQVVIEHLARLAARGLVAAMQRCSGAAAPDGAWLQAWLRLAQSRRRPCITKLYLRVRRCLSRGGSSQYAEVAGFENRGFGSRSAKVCAGAAGDSSQGPRPTHSDHQQGVRG